MVCLFLAHIFPLGFIAFQHSNTNKGIEFLEGCPYFPFLEPIGSAKPKFSEDINSKGITREQSSETTLVCPAQSFPLPSFRSVQILCQQGLSS